MKSRAIDPAALHRHAIYVSSVMGDDANDGLSIKHPKRTIDGARSSLRDGYPDWILLRPGETYESVDPASRMLGEVLAVLLLILLAIGCLWAWLEFVA